MEAAEPVTTTYQYDNANRLEWVNGSIHYDWDNNGNLTNDGVYTYAYDGANRLVSASDGISVSRFDYNGRGDRTRQDGA